MRFSKSSRLLNKNDFDRVFEQARKFVGKNCVMYYAPALREQQRIGIIVSKKVGVAAQRNKTKRIIREWFRKDFSTLEINQKVDVVIVARPGFTRSNKQEIQNDFVFFGKSLAVSVQ